MIFVKEWRVMHIQEMGKREDAGTDKGVYFLRKILGMKDTAMVDRYGTRKHGGE